MAKLKAGETKIAGHVLSGVKFPGYTIARATTEVGGAENLDKALSKIVVAEIKRNVSVKAKAQNVAKTKENAGDPKKVAKLTAEAIAAFSFKSLIERKERKSATESTIDLVSTFDPNMTAAQIIAKLKEQQAAASK